MSNLSETKNKNRIKLFIPSYLSSLATIRAMIRTYLQEHRVGKTEEVQLISIVDELTTNAIEHAYKEEKGEIKIVLNFYKGTFFLAVEDYGLGFLEDAATKEDGGMGLMIAKKLVDVFEIKKKSKGTTFKIKKRVKEAI